MKRNHKSEELTIKISDRRCRNTIVPNYRIKKGKSFIIDREFEYVFDDNTMYEFDYYELKDRVTYQQGYTGEIINGKVDSWSVVEENKNLIEYRINVSYTRFGYKCRRVICMLVRRKKGQKYNIVENFTKFAYYNIWDECWFLPLGVDKWY